MCGEWLARSESARSMMYEATHAFIFQKSSWRTQKSEYRIECIEFHHNFAAAAPHQFPLNKCHSSDSRIRTRRRDETEISNRIDVFIILCESRVCVTDWVYLNVNSVQSIYALAAHRNWRVYWHDNAIIVISIFFVAAVVVVVGVVVCLLSMDAS